MCIVGVKCGAEKDGLSVGGEGQLPIWYHAVSQGHAPSSFVNACTS